MPTYEYACTGCGQHLEVVQSMSDAPLTACAVCGGRLRKVFAPIGIVFKGSGFYRTDSRARSAAPAGDGSRSDERPSVSRDGSPSSSSKPGDRSTGSRPSTSARSERSA